MVSTALPALEAPSMMEKIISAQHVTQMVVPGIFLIPIDLYVFTADQAIIPPFLAHAHGVLQGNIQVLIHHKKRVLNAV